MSIENVVTSRTVTRNIADLNTEFFVRKALDADWACHLALILDGGTELEPIWITPDNRVIDGRHRIEAHLLAKRTEIKCKIVEVANEIELIVLALKANMGSGLPAQSQDIEHTISMLLARGVPKKDLIDLIPLPAKLVRKYINEVESKAERARLQKAALAVESEGLSVAKAAELHSVSEEKLKRSIFPKRKKKSSGASEVKREATKLYRSIGLKNAAVCRKLMEAYEDGDVQMKEVLAMFDHMEHLQQQSGRALADWKKRFASMEAPKKLRRTA